MLDPIAECVSLTEVRDNIDRLDRQIVALLAERGGFVKQAAGFKKNSDDVKAPRRVEQVIVKVTCLARELGANPQVVEQVYRAMIAAFIDVELSAHQARGRDQAEMANELFQVDFAQLPWQEPAPGVRFKSLSRQGKVLRLLELSHEFAEDDWCQKGHWGCLLAGELELITPLGTQQLTAGDGLFIEANQPHKAQVVAGTARLILVEQA